MEQLLLNIVKALVEKPDDAKIETIVEDNDIVFNVIVAEDDLGRVIGKNGRIAQSLRSLVKCIGTKDKKRYIVKIGGR